MTNHILFELRGSVAFATLNRPTALNALTLEMAQAYGARLAAWGSDPAVRAVVLRGLGDRAFCAGGDIRSLCRGKDLGDFALISDFFRLEYAMDLAVARFPKPHIALWDGVVMGGGVGISLYGSHRVATERTVFAMPETAIGFLCDVGASWFLPRLPDHVGCYLGLTGSRLGPADALALGLATHFVAGVRLEEVIDALLRARWEGDPAAVVGGTLDRFAADPGPPPIEPHRPAIERCFSAGSVAEIVGRLEAEGTTWAEETLGYLRVASPTSLEVVHRALRRGASLDLEEALAMEYRLSRRLVAGHDFCEGVRALLVDRDGAPRWCPGRLEEVEEASVEALFAPLDGEEPVASR